MSRRLRSSATPDLGTVLERMDSDPRESVIYKEVRAVSTHFKNDTAAIAAFWFQPGLPYNVRTDEVHQAIVRRILGETGLTEPVVCHFLDGILSRSVLQALGVQRVQRETSRHYRILVGSSA